MQVLHRTIAVLVLALWGATAAVAAGDPDRAFAEARQLADDGKYRKALAIYETLAEFRPDNIDYLVGLGRAQLALRRMLPASWTLEEAIALDPDREQAYRLLLRAYVESGRSEQAYAILQRARQRFGKRPWMEAN